MVFFPLGRNIFKCVVVRRIRFLWNIHLIPVDWLFPVDISGNNSVRFFNRTFVWHQLRKQA
jgi:hypothetical protein